MYIEREEIKMSKLLNKASIEDVQNTGCTELEQEYLLDTFTSLMKRSAVMLLSKGEFNLADFKYSKSNFILKLERKLINGQEQWWGVFQDGEKLLKVIGTLEEC